MFSEHGRRQVQKQGVRKTSLEILQVHQARLLICRVSCWCCQIKFSMQKTYTPFLSNKMTSFHCRFRQVMLLKLSSSIARTFCQQRQAFSTSPALRGLEEFFEAPLKEGEQRNAGGTLKLYKLIRTHHEMYNQRRETDKRPDVQGKLGRLKIWGLSPGTTFTSSGALLKD